MNKPEYFAGSQLMSLNVALDVAGLARHAITKVQAASADPATEFSSALGLIPLMMLTKMY